MNERDILVKEDAYKYALEKLAEADNIENGPYANKVHLIYQTLMDFCLLKNTESVDAFIVRVKSKIYYVAQKILRKNNPIFDFHEFMRLGCLIKGLTDEEASLLFLEFKKRRNKSLQKQKTLQSYLLCDKDFEAEDINRIFPEKFMHDVVFEMIMDDTEENICIRLKDSATEDTIAAAISEFYVAQGFKVKKDKFLTNVYERKSGHIRKSVNLSHIEAMNNKSGIALISINNYE